MHNYAANYINGNWVLQQYRSINKFGCRYVYAQWFATNHFCLNQEYLNLFYWQKSLTIWGSKHLQLKYIIEPSKLVWIGLTCFYFKLSIYPTSCIPWTYEYANCQCIFTAGPKWEIWKKFKKKSCTWSVGVAKQN